MSEFPNSENIADKFGYASLDVRYKFRKTADWPICYPFKYGRGCFRELLRRSRPTRNLQNDCDLPVDALPDVVLSEVFRYLHPLDLVHSISTVSKRWNRLSRNPALYTSVRVVTRGVSPDHIVPVRTFLSRISRCVRNLSIRCVEMNDTCAQASTLVLPDLLPVVKVLEIEGINEYSAEQMQKISNCFPNVETLLIDYTNQPPMSQNVSSVLYDASVLIRLKRLHISSRWCSVSPDSCQDHVISLFGKWNFQLQAFIHPLWMSGVIRTMSVIGRLTELSLSRFNDSDGVVIGKLKNLKKLSLDFQFSLITDTFFTHLKYLSKIEHFHLCFRGNQRSYHQLAILFKLTDENAEEEFPYRLKHLKFEEYYYFRRSLVQAIIDSCPQLSSLGIRGCPVVSWSASQIVSRLKNLRFLDISETDRRGTENGWENELRKIADPKILPKLELLLALNANKTNLKQLEEIREDRKSLVVLTEKFQMAAVQWDFRKSAYVFVKPRGSQEHRLFESEDGFCCMSDCVAGSLQPPQDDSFTSDLEESDG